MSSRFWCLATLMTMLAMAYAPVRADDQEKFQGTWRMIFAEIGAKEKSKGERKELQLVIEGSKFTMVEGDKKELVHFTLDSGSKPRHIDFYRNSDKKEKVWHGIYGFDGKDLKICWGPANAERPKDFEAKKSDHNRYLIVKKK